MSRQFPIAVYWRLIIGSVMTLMLALAICCKPSGAKVTGNMAADSWYNPPDLSLRWNELEDDAVAQVRSAGLSEALQLLEARAFLPLSNEERERLGETARLREGCRPYLVRALRLRIEGPNVKFKVYYHQKTIRIVCGALTHSTPGIDRAALIIWLPFAPEKVYVSVDVAE